MVFSHFGEVLKLRRIELGIETDEIERDTKIAQKYILAIEEKKFTTLPSEVYTKNFIKTYANFLDIYSSDIDEYIDEFHAFQEKERGILSLEKVKKTKTVTPYLNVHKILRQSIVALMVLLSFSYLGWQVKKIFQPPFLEIMYPENNLILSTNTLTLSGKTESEVELSINESRVLINGDGSFNLTVDLQKGMNLLKISAKKKHGKETAIYRQILVEGKDGKELAARDEK